MLKSIVLSQLVLRSLCVAGLAGLTIGAALSQSSAIPSTPMPPAVAMAYTLDAYQSGKLKSMPGGSALASRLDKINARKVSARLLSKFYGSGKAGEKTAASRYGAWGAIRSNTVVPSARFREALQAARRSAPRAERFMRCPPYSAQYGLAASLSDRVANTTQPLDPIPTWESAIAALNPAAVAPVAIRFMGIHCMEEQLAGGADEPYVITTVFGVTGSETVTERSPFPQANYEGVDDGNIRVGPYRNIWTGEPQELNVGVVVMEHDDDNPEETKELIKLAVEIAHGIALLAGAPPIPEELRALIATGIAELAGLGPDMVGRTWIVTNAAELNAMRTGPLYHLKKDGMDLSWHMAANVSGDGKYRVMYTVDPAMPPSRWPCSLRVHRVEMIDEPGDSPDYWVRLTIQENAWKSSRKDDKRVVDPGSSWKHTYDAYGDNVALKIELFDYDSTSSDDACDISPVAGRRELQINCDRASGRISGDITGRVGDILTVNGTSDKNRAKLRFSVDFVDAPD